MAKITTVPPIKTRVALVGIEEANFNYANAWKEESYKLLTTLRNKDAVQWCGETSHVSRTLSDINLAEYTDWIYSHWNEIMDGSLDIFSTLKYKSKSGKKDERPISWTSKICHILNPYDYPLIWDSKVRNWLRNIGKADRTLWEAVSRIMQQPKTVDRQKCYEEDSIIWATH